MKEILKKIFIYFIIAICINYIYYSLNADSFHSDNIFYEYSGRVLRDGYSEPGRFDNSDEHYNYIRLYPIGYPIALLLGIIVEYIIPKFKNF